MYNEVNVKEINKLVNCLLTEAKLLVVYNFFISNYSSEAYKTFSTHHPIKHSDHGLKAIKTFTGYRLDY